MVHTLSGTSEISTHGTCPKLFQRGHSRILAGNVTSIITFSLAPKRVDRNNYSIEISEKTLLTKWGWGLEWNVIPVLFGPFFSGLSDCLYTYGQFLGWGMCPWSPSRLYFAAMYQNNHEMFGRLDFGLAQVLLTIAKFSEITIN